MWVDFEIQPKRAGRPFNASPSDVSTCQNRSEKQDQKNVQGLLKIEPMPVTREESSALGVQDSANVFGNRRKYRVSSLYVARAWRHLSFEGFWTGRKLWNGWKYAFWEPNDDASSNATKYRQFWWICSRISRSSECLLRFNISWHHIPRTQRHSRFRLVPCRRQLTHFVSSFCPHRLHE